MNNNKIRKALIRARHTLNKWRDDTPISAWYEIDETLDSINDALAEPLRNCDVGTAEEQGFKFDEFCRSHWGKNGMLGDNCEHCPLDRFNCRLEWSQMPYEEVKNAANS